MAKAVSACCITLPPRPPLRPTYTPSPWRLAVWAAFPPADYYGCSVSLGLSPGRRIPRSVFASLLAVDVQGGLGASFVPLPPLEAGLPPWSVLGWAATSPTSSGKPWTSSAVSSQVPLLIGR